MKLSLFVGLLIWVLCECSYGAIIPADMDTTLLYTAPVCPQGDCSSMNFGQKNSFLISASQARADSLVSFPLTNIPTFRRVMLGLYLEQLPFGMWKQGDSISIYPVTSNWDELKVTAATAPTIGNKIGEIRLVCQGTTEDACTGRYYEGDITSFLGNLINSGHISEISFLLRSSTSTLPLTVWTSREGTNAPYLKFDQGTSKRQEPQSTAAGIPAGTAVSGGQQGAAASAPPVCIYRTFDQEKWGTICPQDNTLCPFMTQCFGDQPLTIACEDPNTGFSIEFDNMQSIANFLPFYGPVVPFTKKWVNPSRTLINEGGTLLGEIISLEMNLMLDGCAPNFACPVPFEQLVICDLLNNTNVVVIGQQVQQRIQVPLTCEKFCGMSVSAVLDAAEDAVIQCPDEDNRFQLNDYLSCISLLNRAFISQDTSTVGRQLTDLFSLFLNQGEYQTCSACPNVQISSDVASQQQQGGTQIASTM